MITEMNISRAKKSDAKSLSIIGICVWADSYLIEGVDRVVADYINTEFSIKIIAKNIEYNNVYVLKESSSVVGYVVVTEDGGKSEISNFYILPKFQGKGYGRVVLSYLRNLHSNLWLTCWHKNSRALKFYYANGFYKTGETYFELGDERHKNEVLTSVVLQIN